MRLLRIVHEARYYTVLAPESRASVSLLSLLSRILTDRFRRLRSFAYPGRGGRIIQWYTTISIDGFVYRHSRNTNEKSFDCIQFLVLSSINSFEIIARVQLFKKIIITKLLYFPKLELNLIKTLENKSSQGF